MTVALSLTHPVNMPGYKQSDDLHEVDGLHSFTQSMVPHALFSFSHTEPTDLLVSTWGTTEGAQNFSDYADNGSCHSGDAEDMYLMNSGNASPTGLRLDRNEATDIWAATGFIPALTSGGQAMSRVNSSRSNGSLLSHSSHMSGNASAFRDGSHATGTMVGVDSSCHFGDADASALQPQVYWPNYGLDTSLDIDGAAFNTSPVHVVPSQMQYGPDACLPDHSSPGSWASFSSSISRTSSPATVDDSWLQIPRVLSSQSSPEIPCQSPSIDIKPFICNEEINGMGIPPLGETLSLPPPFGARRDSGDSARSHDLYKNATPKDDGLFHCPWEGKPCCNHRPEKLKCNYDKFVDSHLKPYRCKAEACEGARFSSTACLLRHEREAHGLHGHGDKPFLCHYKGCERGTMGNGFPRQWNLKDHMKRVHNDTGSNNSLQGPAVTSEKPVKGRKRKADTSEAPAAPSRKNSKNAAPKETKPAPKPLVEQWADHRKAVEEMLNALSKPEDIKNIKQLSEMQKRLTAMTEVASNLTSVTMMPPPSRVGYAG